MEVVMGSKPQRMRYIEMTGGEYEECEENNDGFCLKCGHHNDGGCEPDASNYYCFECGQDAVEGMGNLMLLSMIIIISEEE
jgi:hypothetical protein